MRITLRGKNYDFPDNIEPEERNKLIHNFLKQTIIVGDEEYDIELYYRETWFVESTKRDLDRIATYLVKMPNQNGKHDKEILSNNDIMEMEKGVRWQTEGNKRVIVPARYTNFSDLKLSEKVETGIVDIDEIRY